MNLQNNFEILSKITSIFMKTVLFFLILCLPQLIFGQPKLAYRPYTSPPIFTEGKGLINQNYPDSAVSFVQAILSRPKLDKITQCQALLVSGWGHYRGDDPDAAVLSFQKSLSIARSIKNEPLILNALIALSASMITKKYPQRDSALMYLEEAKPLAASLKDTLNQARVYNTLANLYLEEEDLETALVHCDLGETILKNDKFETEIGACYNTKGAILYNLFYRDGKKDNLQSAIPYFQKSASIFKNLGNKQFEANARMNMGVAFAFLDDYGRAETETKMVIKLGEEIKDSAILLGGYYNLANHYEGENRTEEAKLALNKMYWLLEKNGTAEDAAFVTDLFSNNAIKVSTAFVKNKMDMIDKQLEIEKRAQEKQLSWFISIVLALIVLSVLIYSYQKNKLNAQEKKLLEAKQKSLQGEVVDLLTEFNETQFEEVEQLYAKIDENEIKANILFDQPNTESKFIVKANELKSMLSENKVSEVIENLLNETKTTNYLIYNEVIMVKSRHSNNNKYDMNGVIKAEDFRMEALRIVKNLIHLIDTIYKKEKDVL
ncbi:MAG: hypothetical protein ACKVT2_16205 [Saprospiraceae bacterium]